MKNFLRNNGLSLTMFAFFLVFLIGQSLAGWHEHNDELFEHHAPPLDYFAYLRSGNFMEATMENWESEFLQMFAYILFTTFLFQRGSSESKSLDEAEEVDRDPRLSAHKPEVPWPVQRGSWWLRIYEYSLSLAFLVLFLVSFALHAWGGMRDTNDERLLRGELPTTLLEYLGSSRFWHESLQNWQSEFLAIWSMVVFSIWLRQRGSPESKPVDAPHSQTGG